MIRAAAWLVASGIHLGVPIGGFIAYALVNSLPPERIGGDPFFPPRLQLNPLSLVQGASEAEVDALFRVSPGRSQSSRTRCVRYQYSPRLSYVVLFQHGVVETMWLEEGGFTPYPCEGILSRTVHVRLQPWLPAEPPRPDRECGCPPLMSLTCPAW